MAYRDQHSPEAQANKKKRQADYRDRKRKEKLAHKSAEPPAPRASTKGPVGVMASVLSEMPLGAMASLKADLGAECIELARRIVQEYPPEKATPRDAVALAQFGFIMLEHGQAESQAENAEKPRFLFSERVLQDPEQLKHVLALMRARKAG